MHNHYEQQQQQQQLSRHIIDEHSMSAAKQAVTTGQHGHALTALRARKKKEKINNNNAHTRTEFRAQRSALRHTWIMKNKEAEIGKSTRKTQRKNFRNSIFIFDNPKTAHFSSSSSRRNMFSYLGKIFVYMWMNLRLLELLPVGG